MKPQTLWLGTLAAALAGQLDATALQAVNKELDG